jgi:hypothetical protein
MKCSIFYTWAVMIDEKNNKFVTLKIETMITTQANPATIAEIPKIVKRFFEFDNNHPEIYKYFQKFALEAIGDKPTRTVGAQLIAERIRWEIIIKEDKTEDFKFPNEFVPGYARKFMQLNPRYRGLINTRSSVFDPYFIIKN